jgi:hypothetical protein
MTNEDYRKMRGTDKPFNTDQAQEAWRALFGKDIDAAAKRAKVHAEILKLRFARQRAKAK